MWWPYQKCLCSLPCLHGISYRICYPHIPQQNGNTKCKIYITEAGLTVLLHTILPKSFLFEAFTIVIYLINLLPTPLFKTNLHIFFSPHLISHLCVFRCICFPFLSSFAMINLHQNQHCVFLVIFLRTKAIAVLIILLPKCMSQQGCFLETDFLCAKNSTYFSSSFPSSLVTLPLLLSLPYSLTISSPSSPPNLLPIPTPTPSPQYPLIACTHDHTSVPYNFSNFITYNTITHNSSNFDPTFHPNQQISTLVTSYA